MLYVSRFGNPELKTGKYTTVRIAVGVPRWPLGYEIAGDIGMLAPYGILTKYPEYEDFKRAYFKRLDSYGVEKILRVLNHFVSKEKDTVLLCYEDIRKPGEWCHRTLFAEWWKEKTGEIVDELIDPTAVKIVESQTGKRQQQGETSVNGLSKKANKLIREREEELQQIRMF